jgi:hypothetical protein
MSGKGFLVSRLRMIRYLLDVPEAFKRKSDFALRLLLEGEGIVAVRASTLEEADLVYSDREPGPTQRGAVWIQHTAADWDDPSTPIHLAADFLHVGHSGTGHPADIVFATYFIVTGAAEADQPRNEIGVPIARGSRLWTKGILQKPVVADLARELRRRLEKSRVAANRVLQSVPRWPDGNAYAIVLTHDVDRPLSRPPAAHYRARISRDWQRGDHRAVARGVAGFVRNVVLAGDSGRKPEKDRQFGFDGWMREARTLGVRSAFYVAVRGAADALGYRQDVYYDASHPSIVAAMRRALDDGFEVGLHASIACRAREDLFVEERERLSQLLGGHPVTGLRHHYWALDAEIPEDTLAAHERAGFRYDSSLGMNDAPGFRRGMAWPFRPFDRRSETELSITQVPPTAMDAGVFYYGGAHADAPAELDAHVDRVKSAGGCAVLNWHLAQIDPKRMSGAGPAAVRMMQARRSSGDAIWWTTPSGLVSWWEERRTLVFPDLATL